VRLAVKVVPGATRERIVGWLGDALKVTVAAPPERGYANRAVAELLERTLGVAVRLVAGERSPRKVFEVADLDEAAVRQRILASAAVERPAPKILDRVAAPVRRSAPSARARRKPTRP
jgi:uncharacterized protein (TIGR00251 family)